MDAPFGGKLWDYDFSVNGNHISDDPFGSGFLEPNLSELPSSYWDVDGNYRHDHQQLGFNFTASVLEEFEKEYTSVEYQQNSQYQQSYNAQNLDVSSQELASNPLMVNDQGSFMLEEFPTNSTSMAFDYNLSFQETEMIDHIPTFEWDVIVEESALFDHVSVPEGTFQDLMATPNMAHHDHVVPSNAGHLMIEETNQTLVTNRSQFISLGQEGAVEGVLFNIQRPILTFCGGSKLRVRWTPALHACFVNAVNQLGGIESATPQSIVSIMKVPGLNRFHVKSHLQKFRNGGTRFRGQRG